MTAWWKESSFANASPRLLRKHREFKAQRLLRVTVFDRLSDPDSKAGDPVLAEAHPGSRSKRRVRDPPAPATQEGFPERALVIARWIQYHTVRCTNASELAACPPSPNERRNWSNPSARPR